MAQAKFREVTVAQSERLTPNLQRVWLEGEDLADFPENGSGDYFKLLFNAEGEAIQSVAELEALDGKPVLRTYTARKFDAKTGRLTVDFVRHVNNGHTGPASYWADHAKPGDRMVIRGPAVGKTIQTQADSLIFAADMTALPALSAMLEQLPADCVGTAIIEVLSEADQQTLKTPDNVDVHWVVNPEPSQANTVLSDAVKALAWPTGKVSVWAACEFSNMKLLRDYFKQDRTVPREHLYISSYWKAGNTEEQHKVVKRADAETQEA